MLSLIEIVKNSESVRLALTSGDLVADWKWRHLNLT
jgi:hypothetical protein